MTSTFTQLLLLWASYTAMSCLHRSFGESLQTVPFIHPWGFQKICAYFQVLITWASQWPQSFKACSTGLFFHSSFPCSIVGFRGNFSHNFEAERQLSYCRKLCVVFALSKMFLHALAIFFPLTDLTSQPTFH